MYKVWMYIDDENWEYGIYESRDRANEVAMIVREERNVDVWIEEV